MELATVKLQKEKDYDPCPDCGDERKNGVCPNCDGEDGKADGDFELGEEPLKEEF